MVTKGKMPIKMPKWNFLKPLTLLRRVTSRERVGAPAVGPLEVGTRAKHQPGLVGEAGSVRREAA